MNNAEHRLQPGVAAHHAVTADAALEILRDGGTAADAAVAGVLASGVAESLLTTLLGGGHGIYVDAATQEITLLDFFVTIPGLGRDVPEGRSILDGIGRTVDIVFESEPIPYEIGCDTAGVPGVPAGCGLLHERWGRLPWKRLVEPALAAVEAGVTMLPTPPSQAYSHPAWPSPYSRRCWAAGTASTSTPRRKR